MSGRWFGLFFHLDTPEVVELIMQSGELWGTVVRNSFMSAVPAVKAFAGRLPIDKVGVEFTTTVKPSNGHPTIPWWQAGAPGVAPAPRPGFVRIPVHVLCHRLRASDA